MDLSNNFIKSYNHRLDENIHSPIDVYIAKSIYRIFPYIVKNNINSSQIYLVSLILSIITYILVNKNIKYIPGITFMLSYYFNTMYFIHVEYNSNKDINIISFRETIFNVITVIFLLNSLYSKDLHKYIVVTILFIGLLCNLGCQIQYFKKEYPEERIPFIFSKLFSLTCPLGTCSNNLSNLNNNRFISKKEGAISHIISNVDDVISNNKLPYFKEKGQLNMSEQFTNKIHTKYMDSGTIFLVISLYLAFL